jgi:hypothetical protein
MDELPYRSSAPHVIWIYIFLYGRMMEELAMSVHGLLVVINIGGGRNYDNWP